MTPQSTAGSFYVRVCMSPLRGWRVVVCGEKGWGLVVFCCSVLYDSGSDLEDKSIPQTLGLLLKPLLNHFSFLAG